MKKFLSIVLCLAMLMSTVPVTVFAAPAAVTTGDSVVELYPELPAVDSAEAELAADTEYVIEYAPGNRYVTVSGNGITGNAVPRGGKYGDVVTLPKIKTGRHGFVCNDERYVIDGWTDGKNEYAEQSPYTITGDVTFYPNLKPVGDGFKVNFTTEEQFADSYNGLSVLYVAVDDSINLSDAAYALTAPVGYTVLGWKNASTGELATKVTGAKDEVVTLVAAFEFRSGIVVDTEAKVSEFDVVAGAGSFDAETLGFKVIPEDKSCTVTFANLALNADEYSYVEVTYAVNGAPANGGEIVLADGVAYGTKVSEEADYVTYRYDLAASEAWLGTCSEIGVKPGTGAEFTIAEIKFVENEGVAFIDVTELEVPAISATPDVEAVVPADAAYEITNITWNPVSEYFMGSTEYTATVELAINKSGYMFNENTVALLNGEDVTAEFSAKTAVITKTFAATEAPAALEITLTSATAISVNNGTLELAVEIAPVEAGNVILPDTYTWSITSGKDLATLDGNVLTAMWDGTVEVTVTPDYDVNQAKTFAIEITNQVGYTVTYEKNTGAEVSNMPGTGRAKKDYTVSPIVPAREGFSFDGWMLSPEADVTVKNIKVTKDITLYAKWVKGGHIIDFNNPGDEVDASGYVAKLANGNLFETNGAAHSNPMTIDTEKGEASFVLNGGNDFYMTVKPGSSAINLDYVSAIEYGLRTDAEGTVQYVLYFATKDPVTGEWIAPDHKNGGDVYAVDNKMSVQATKADGDVNKLHVFTVDMSGKNVWRGNLDHTRLDIENSGSFPGATFYIDYIKFIGVDSVETFELDITAPEASVEAYGLEAVSTSSDKYEIKNITWEGPELVDGKYYAGASEYTAKVELKVANGYEFSDAPIGAFVNGEAADVVVDGEKAFVTYTFPATKTLEEVEVQIRVKDNAPAEITESFGTLQLISRVVPVSDGDIDNDEVYWSIDASQKRYAWVDEDGLVTGNTDCENLVVTATSKYDPSKKATIVIKVSGQIPEKNVYFEAGTGDKVTNLRGPELAKDEYVLPMDIIPERTSYMFKGWSKEIGGDIIKVDDVKEDTTYYAVWGYAFSDEMKTSTVFNVGDASSSFVDGFMVVVPSNPSERLNEGFSFQKQDIKFKDGLLNSKVPTSAIDYLEIKTTLAPDELELCVYVGNADKDGNVLNAIKNETANTRFYSNKKSIAANPGQNIADYVEKNGEWYVYKLPAKLFKNWSEYLYHLRLNFIRRDVNAEKGAEGFLAYPEGTEIKFDYIKFVGRDVPALDITGIAAPVVKGEAAKTAEALQNSFEVTSVEWSPELLGGTFFGSGIEYTATIKVAPFATHHALSTNPARVTVNGEEASYKRKSAKEAEIKVTFPATEDVGYELTLVNVNLHEKVDGANKVEVQQIFSGEDFDIDKLSAKYAPTGKRWIGWSETEGGELVSGVINVTEDVDYYACYEDIIGYDFSNKYHKNEKNVTAKNGSVLFDGAWVVVTPDKDDSKAELTLDGMNISSADYDYIEIIYDGTLEDPANYNKFSESFVPALKVNGSTSVALSKAEPVVVNNRVAYKYTYDLTINGKPETITSFTLAPYTGKPAWAITSVSLVPNEPLTGVVEITGIDTPDTWLMPDETAEVSEGYVVESVKWSPVEELNADGSFKASTEYTVTVVLKPVTGTKIATEEATVNGEAADSATLGTNGKLTVVKTFAETSALIPFELTVDDAVIDVADGTVTLVPNFSVDLDVKAVKWNIEENKDKAKIDPDTGVVTALYDGVVTVKATSVYNPLVSATATVTISNQIASYTIKFDANTTSEVTNMPATDYDKYEYTLPAQIPVRNGFSFAGWSKTPGDKVTVAADYITKDTTYYALWVRGTHYEFFNENENPGMTISLGTVDYENVDYENGVMVFSPKISSYNSLDTTILIQKDDKSPLFKGSDYPKIAIRVKSDMSSSAKHKVYYTSKATSSAGKDVTGFSEAEACMTEAIAIDSEYTEIIVDMTSKNNWREGNITSIRIDLLDNGADLSHTESTITVDYIRAVSYETGVVEVTGVDAPVSKALADTDAVSADESKYVVTNVTWEGDELAYKYYFGAEKVYTACVTVKGAPGYCVSDVPSKATVNGKPATSTSYNAVTGELTLKYTFPATEPVENETAYEVNLYGMDDNGNRVNVPRTIYEGESFAIGTTAPDNIPAGKRWIGWSETENATENTVGESVLIDGPKTFYAVFEDLVEFDYSNYYHQFGTTAKSGKLSFENGLAVVTPDAATINGVLTTPELNIYGKDFSLIEVYYSSTLSSVIDGEEYPNIFSASLRPELKFSKDGAEEDFINGNLIAADSEVINGASFRKYVYDMSGVSKWNDGKIANLRLDAYTGYPAWGVGFIKLIANEEITDTAEFELAAPATWETPATADEVVVKGRYEVVSLEWNPVATVFAANAAYTANITYKPVAGYKVADLKATINGEKATAKDNLNGTFFVSYVFDMTDKLKDVDVAISGENAITVRGRYLDLKATVTAKDGSALPETGVTWSVDKEETAKISENGRIYPVSNGKVVVTATSKYNPKAKATYTITVSNQYDLVKVTFDKNTYANVENMPEYAYVYGNFVPENYAVKRDGFFLTGWSIDEDALEPDASFNITEDTTLYAKWSTGYELSFDNLETSLPATNRDVTFNNGIATYTAAKDASSTSNFIIGEKSGLKSLLIPTATTTKMEIKFRAPSATLVRNYLRSSTADGSEMSPWDESANKGSTTGGTIAPTGDFTTVSFDLTAHANWNMKPYFERIRLDIPAGITDAVEVDYIRFHSSERRIKFDANGGLIPFNGDYVTSIPWEKYGLGTISLPADPVKDGKMFIGWAKDPVNYRKLYKNSFVVSDETILYAIWADANSIDENKVTAEGAQVEKSEISGAITITSEVETTPVVTISDSITVGENKTLLIKLSADYAATVENAETVLTFVDGNGVSREVVVATGELSGEATLVLDLSEEEGFEGTITDVTLTLAGGVINELTLESVAFVSDEIADEFIEKTPDLPANNDDVTSSTGGGTPTMPKPAGSGAFPSLGGGSVTEKPSTTTQTSDKKVNVPARPKDEVVEQGTTTPATPSTNSKFKFTNTYDNRFTDVAATSWYAADVEKSYKLGLMNGKSADGFAPDGTVTLAEAITVAARMNAIYNGQTITQGTGNSWYKPYVEYATKKAIISSTQYSDYTALATREQVAVMFVKALPASWYKEQNLFLTIPDVPASSASFAAIQRLYNAGVVIGVDNAYNFKPTENIKRSELSAIINRVALTESRLRVVTEDEKNNKDKKFGVDEIMNTLTVGNCAEKTFVEKDGYAYAVPAKPDPVVFGLHDLMGGTLNANEYKTIKVVLTSSQASAMVGQQAQLFFSKDGTLSEANSLRTKIEKSADGTLFAKFDGKSNAGWNGDMTVVRFDPWNNTADFSLLSITFAP